MVARARDFVPAVRWYLSADALSVHTSYTDVFVSNSSPRTVTCMRICMQDVALCKRTTRRLLVAMRGPHVCRIRARQQ